MKKANKVLLVATLLSLSALVGCGGGKDPSSVATSGTTSDTTSGTTSSSSSSEVDVKKPFTPENYASGPKSYAAESYEERTKILGLLESYAVKNNLTGLTMFEDGAYIMYDNSVVKGTENYIPGYGFGVVSEGYVNADLAYESNAKWKRYYHTYETEDPNTINYQNDKGSVVGSLIGYVGGSYWANQMNEFKDGYDWVPQIANSERPIAVNANDKGLATKYKFEVKVGSELKYRTGSSKLSEYNGREVTLEDYVTPYKIYYTKAYGMARGGENLTGSGSIKGSQNYYNQSSDGFNASAWNDLGIKAYTEGGKSYLEFTFNTPCNTFYAMYYLNSSMFAPVPEDFIKELGNGDFATGVKAWGNYTDGGLTPVDTYLSTGPYYIEAWERDVQVVFGKNELFKCQDEQRYQMAGVHYRILKGAADDENLVFNEFLAGHLHASGIPQTQLDKYKNDPRTTRTVGESTTKLNLNTCTQERWIELFGENGTITQTSKDKYWQCEPAMSNSDFIAGLNYAFDRETYASKRGYTPSANYFGSGYLSNPEDGISYNSTEAHKNAVEKLQEGTNYGYNLEFAKASFKKASEKLIADGIYKAGDTITLETAWMVEAQRNTAFKDTEKFWEDAFNNCGGGLKLDVTFWAGSQVTDVYYAKMMVGQFDIAYGGIEGNPLNPLNFLEVLKSDNSSTFTLNWGPDTNVVSEDLYYDGCYWSFDSLWQAADTSAYLENGVVSPVYSLDDQVLEKENFVLNADGTATATVKMSFTSMEGATAEVSNVKLFAAVGVDEADKPVYAEDAVDFTVGEDGTVTITISKELVEKYQSALVIEGEYYNFSFDIYVTTHIAGIDSDHIVSSYIITPGVFPVLETAE